MPEGDTLFVWARSIDAALTGKTLVYATSNRVRLSGLIGHRVSAARSYGKQLLVEFDDGRILRTHLRMHGKIRVRDGSHMTAPVNPHVRWLLSTSDKTALCLDAPSVELFYAKDLDTHPILSRLGPDVLAPELDLAEILLRLRANGERAIGSAVMDQEILAGIGNVYKSEVLFMAELSPFVRVADIDEVKLTEVVQVARRLLRRNLGSSRRTTPQGRVASPYWAYGRSGEPCLRCGERIAMKRQDPLARSTYYCPECQLPKAAEHE